MEVFMKFREWLEELEYDVISGNLDIEVGGCHL